MSKAGFIIRWDDVSPYQDQTRYRKLIDLFVRYDVPAVLGVVPENRDETIRFDTRDEGEFVAELHELQKKGWEIAQHGFRHIKHTEEGGVLGINAASEFAGRSPEQQAADIEAGRKILRDYGFEPVTFIPPWHSYDEATIMALAGAGFKVLSDGVFLYPRMTGGLLQLPMIFWTVPGRLKTLNRLGAVYTICIHPQQVGDDELKRWERFFGEAASRVTTASPLLDEAAKLTRPSLKKKILERTFGAYYRRQN